MIWCTETHPDYLITAKISISSAKKPVFIPQANKIWMCLLVDSPFMEVRLPTINAKSFQSLISHRVDKLTSKLLYACEKLDTIYLLKEFHRWNK